jgi:hypothetical protein
MQTNCPYYAMRTPAARPAKRMRGALIGILVEIVLSARQVDHLPFPAPPELAQNNATSLLN